MTFLEAAIEVLRQAGRPLPVKEITERAIKAGLLTHQGRAPEATMQARIAGELKKGEHTLLMRKATGVFGLRRYDKPKAVAPEPAAKGKRRRGKKDAPVAAEVAAPGAEAPVAEATEPAAEVAIDLDQMMQVQPRRYAAPIELPPEETLAEEYKEELEAPVTPGQSEIVDERSADEDRPMLEAIQVRDLDRQRGRRGGRGRNKDKKKGDKPHAPPPKAQPHAKAQPSPKQQPPHAHAQPKPQPQPRHHAPAPAPAPAREAPPAVARELLAPAPREAPGGLAAAAENLLRSLNDPRPIHVRQLAAMAQKRKLLPGGDAEELARALKAALLVDIRARAADGLRPRFRHHGGSLFALPRIDPALAAAEDALAERVLELHRATTRALRERSLRLPPGAFGDLVHAYLSRTGATDIERVKRTDDTTYLTASRGGTRWLVGARAGGGEVGRRSVGELRAGIVAKAVEAGLLLAPAPLGGEAAAALAEPGRAVTVQCGDAFAEALVAAGVGAIAARLHADYLDLDFFAELGEG